MGRVREIVYMVVAGGGGVSSMLITELLIFVF